MYHEEEEIKSFLNSALMCRLLKKKKKHHKHETVKLLTAVLSVFMHVYGVCVGSEKMFSVSEWLMTWLICDINCSVHTPPWNYCHRLIFMLSPLSSLRMKELRVKLPLEQDEVIARLSLFSSCSFV